MYKTMIRKTTDRISKRFAPYGKPNLGRNLEKPNLGRNLEKSNLGRNLEKYPDHIKEFIKLLPDGIILLSDEVWMSITKTLIARGLCPNRIRISEADQFKRDSMAKLNIIYGHQINPYDMASSIRYLTRSVSAIFFKSISSKKCIETIELSIQQIISTQITPVIVCEFDVYSIISITDGHIFEMDYMIKKYFGGSVKINRYAGFKPMQNSKTFIPTHHSVYSNIRHVMVDEDPVENLTSVIEKDLQL